MLTVVGNSVSYAFKRPYVWAPVVALALVLIGIQVPSLINSMLNLIGESTSGVSLFVSGLLLAAYSLKLNGVVAINAAFKSLVQSALMLGLVGFVSIGNPLAGEAVVAGTAKVTIRCWTRNQAITSSNRLHSTEELTNFRSIAIPAHEVSPQ